jgi:hypothetical protein
MSERDELLASVAKKIKTYRREDLPEGRAAIDDNYQIQ